MTKIQKNRSDSEMFIGWSEPEVPTSDFSSSPAQKNKKVEVVTDSHLPESVPKEMERLLMEMKLDFFRRSITDVAYVLKKEGDTLKIMLEPKAKK